MRRRRVSTAAEHAKWVNLSSSTFRSRLEYSANYDYDDLEQSNGGVYIDLGSIHIDDNDDSAITEKDLDQIQQQSESQQTSSSSTVATIEEWRSKHWIVLIDDEPAIRLAIGDYLHSMGYSVITACDGPMAFLEMLLYSCSWSLLNNEGGQDPPPWIDSESKNQLWRLPNCVISDIRMPGGIDGVKLLELLRRPPADDKMIESETKPPMKKRGRPKKVDTVSTIYDSKDDFELLDAIGSDSFDQNERITTPTDQAMQYLNAIRGCIDYFLKQEQPVGRQGEQQQYPNSFEQMPVILLTAKAMISDRIVGYKAGANGYIPKPFRPEELLGMVDNLLRKQEREQHDYLIRTPKYEGRVANANESIEGLSPEEAKDITKELVEIKKMLQAREEQEKTEKEIIDRESLASMLPEALWMFRTGERRKKVFLKEHIRSILSFCYGINLPKTNTRRNKMLEDLEEQSAKHPEKLVFSEEGRSE